MRIKRSTRLLAVAAAMAAATAIALPSANAAAPQEYSADRLAAVSDAVEDSGVEGIAWYVDGKSDRVVVTADSTVSGAEISEIKQEAGTDAAAITFKRAEGTFRTLLGPR